MGLTTAECEQAAWAVTADGTRFRGAAALNIVLDALLGTAGFCFGMYKVPLMQRVQDGTYNWVVRNRRRLPGATPATESSKPWQPEH